MASNDAKRARTLGTGSDCTPPAAKLTEAVDLEWLYEKSRIDSLSLRNTDTLIEHQKWIALPSVIAIIFRDDEYNAQEWGVAVAMAYTEIGHRYRVQFPDGAERILSGRETILIPKEAKHICLSALSGSQLLHEEQNLLTLTVMARSVRNKGRIRVVRRDQLDDALVSYLICDRRLNVDFTWDDLLRNAPLAFRGVLTQWSSTNPGVPFSRSEFIIRHVQGNQHVDPRFLSDQFQWCASEADRVEIFDFILNHYPNLLMHIVFFNTDFAVYTHTVLAALRGDQGKTILCALSQIMRETTPIEWFDLALKSPQPFTEEELSPYYCEIVHGRIQGWSREIYCAFPSTISEFGFVSKRECRRMIELHPQIWSKLAIASGTDCTLIHDRIELARLAVEPALAKNDSETLLNIVREYPTLMNSRVAHVLSRITRAFHLNCMWTYTNMTRYSTCFKTKESQIMRTYELRNLAVSFNIKISVIGYIAHLAREERSAATALMLCSHSARGRFLNADCARHIKSFVYHAKPGLLNSLVVRNLDWLSASKLDVVHSFNRAPYSILPTDARNLTSLAILVERADAAETATLLSEKAAEAESAAKKAELAYEGADSKAAKAAKTAASAAKAAVTASEKAATAAAAAAATAATAAMAAAEAAATRAAAAKASAAAQAATAFF